MELEPQSEPIDLALHRLRDMGRCEEMLGDRCGGDIWGRPRAASPAAPRLLSVAPCALVRVRVRVRIRARTRVRMRVRVRVRG